METALSFTDDMRRLEGLTMDQTILFGLFAAAMLVAWHGGRRMAVALFIAALALSVADYLHHATDRLSLSF